MLLENVLKLVALWQKNKILEVGVKHWIGKNVLKLSVENFKRLKNQEVKTKNID